MATILGNKTIGSIITIKENDFPVNYIVAHKGVPSSLYGSGWTDGVLVLRERCPNSERAWDGTNNDYNNDYENSDIHRYLNDDFYCSIEEPIKNSIRQVKIPYKKGLGGDETGVMTGDNGLTCKVFLLSGYEVGSTISEESFLPVDGSRLALFSDKASRICMDESGKVISWWLRSACIEKEPSLRNHRVCYAHIDGSVSIYEACNTHSVRPAFVLPSNLSVNDDGSVSLNFAPTITGDKSGNLGDLTSGFQWNYTISDTNAGDTLAATLTEDGVQKRSWNATNGKMEAYDLSGDNWLKVAQGAHSVKVAVSDGQETAEASISYTRVINGLSVTLKQPIAADDVMKACSLKVEGLIPDDAVMTYEVTNNGLDDAPVWEDCSEGVKNRKVYNFTNSTAANGPAFNFRITAKRGESGTGGYIYKISGGFE